jgi:hypothetical protein
MQGREGKGRDQQDRREKEGEREAKGHTTTDQSCGLLCCALCYLAYPYIAI